ncbi:hypothetical protein [Streptomyces sp. JJ38]|uniref:hypothetical protein n=1 Tax=Streptomyces sp. JJ38 TaxID=2738128 RepID=UPI001C570DE1|nr:hypothetical protein [Streptomyces sp. JJ38]MBW1599248.1 hypothetical protein [Streptomyces sp. JJ38]
MMTTAEPLPDRVRVRAHCTADTAGGLTFDVVRPEVVGESWDAALLLCRRTMGPGAATEEVRLPLVPVGAGVLRAALPSTMTLAEGVWNAYLCLGGGERARLLPGTHDLHSLTAHSPQPGRTWLGARVPFTTQKGNLALRAWQRWPHAEAAELLVADGALTLRGRLYGAELTPEATLEVTPRQGRGPVASAPVRPEGGGFRCVLPLAGLRPPARDGCALWLRPGAGEAAVRVARILDDVADKQHRLRHPAVPLSDGDRLVRPCYTGANELLLRFEPVRRGAGRTGR